MPSKPITLMLVDDHPLFRAGVVASLRAVADFVVAAEAGDGEAAIDVWQRSRPDVALIDVVLPGMSGVDTVRRIREIDAGAKLLVLSSSSDPQTRAAAAAAGACGYVIKTTRFQDLVAAIRAAAAGPAPRPVAAAPSAATDLGGLTEREYDVLQLLRLGLHYDEIGRTLAITERTARKHVTNIKEKLGAANVAEAVARGFERGLLSLMPLRPPSRGP